MTVGVRRGAAEVRWKAADIRWGPPCFGAKLLTVLGVVGDSQAWLSPEELAARRVSCQHKQENPPNGGWIPIQAGNRRCLGVDPSVCIALTLRLFWL